MKFQVEWHSISGATPVLYALMAVEIDAVIYPVSGSVRDDRSVLGDIFRFQDPKEISSQGVIIAVSTS